MAGSEAPAKKSELEVRVLSAIVMVAIAGTALWLGGWVWTVFIAAVGAGALWEWRALVRGFVPDVARQAAWLAAGVLYIGTAMAILMAMRGGDFGTKVLLMIIFGVIGTDVGAYFAGRTFGGPKIAPAISPSKTWSGLVGGALGAAIMLMGVSWSWSGGMCRAFFPQTSAFALDGPCSFEQVGRIAEFAPQWFLSGLILAIIAQAGDFFESWMKRRAGVKDSGNLIPGHGGLLDRADGMLAVTFVVGGLLTLPMLL